MKARRLMLREKMLSGLSAPAVTPTAALIVEEMPTLQAPAAQTEMPLQSPEVQSSNKDNKNKNLLASFLLGLFGLLSLFMALSPVKPAHAATSSYLNFQARLLTNSGQVVPDGSYNVEFKLYKALTPNGTPDQGACTYNSGTADPDCLWVETRTGANQVSVVNGYLSANLGSVNAFPAINWDQPLWLTMRVGGTGGTPSWDAEMSPRIALTALPYSFVAGQLAKTDGSGHRGTLTFNTVANNPNITIPDVASGTLCIQGSSACGFESTTGTDFIQNRTGSVQTTANFWISGAGIADTALQTPLLDTHTAVALGIGTTNATEIDLNKSTILAAGQYLKITGSGTRPSSPTAGMLYFDTSTNQLLQYNGSKWVSSPRSATKIVAASTSSQAAKDAADYVATGTDDGAGINTNVLNTAPCNTTGCSVYLEEGTYNLGTTSLSVPNNVTLSGAGAGTILKFATNVGSGTYYAITNSDTLNGTHVNVQNLMIDGNKSNQSAGTFYGVYFNNVGDDIPARDGGKINNVIVKNIKAASGIYLYGSSNNTVANNTVTGSDNDGIGDNSGSGNTITGNIIQSNGWDGIFIFAASNNTITGNTTQGNTHDGIEIGSASSNTITGNTAQGNSHAGIDDTASSYDTITGNTAQGNSNYGIQLDGSTSTAVSGNKVHDNGGSTDNNGIYLSSTAVKNSITGNDITDTSCSTTCYAINISFSGANSNYFASNHFTGDGTHTASINDLSGTGNTYSSQSLSPSGDTSFRNATNSTTAFQVQNASGNDLLAIDTQGTNIALGSASAKVNVNLIGSLATQKGTDYATTGLSVDTNFGNTSLVRLTGASAQTIAGIANGRDGYRLTIINAAAQSATIKNNDTTDELTAANLIITGTGSDMTLLTGASVDLVYDSGSSVWRIIGSSSATGGGTYLSKNSADSASAAVTAGNYLYTFTNSSSSVASGVLNLQNGTNSGTILNLKGSSTTAIQLQNANGYNVLVADSASATPHLKVYDGSATGNYVDIYYDDGTSTAIFTASSGTTQIGAGTGPISIDSGATQAVTISGHANSTFTTDSGYLRLDGATGVQIGTPSSNDGLLIFNNHLGTNTVGLKLAANPSTGYTLLLPSGLPASGTLCLAGDNTGQLSFTSCGGGGGGGAFTATLAPEYPNTVLTPDGTNNVGTLTSDFCSGSSLLNINTTVCTVAATDQHHYFSWTANATNDYDIYTQWQVPNDWTSWGATPISFYAWESSASDSVAMTVYKAGTSCGTVTNSSGTAAWSTSSISSLSGCTIAAGDKLEIKIHLTVGVNNEFARVGEITINYNK